MSIHGISTDERYPFYEVQNPGEKSRPTYYSYYLLDDDVIARYRAAVAELKAAETQLEEALAEAPEVTP